MTAKRLGLYDIFCLGLNAIVGSGIFLFPGLMAALAGPASALAFLVCGVCLTVVALCYAELGAMFPRNGASYVYAREAYGPGFGFAVGWLSWVTALFSWAAVAAAVSSQLTHFHPVFSKAWPGRAVAAGLVCLFGYINYRGIKPGARAVNLFTVGKVLPLLIFAAAGLFSSSSANFAPFFGGEGGFGRAVFLALWALQGFEVAPVAAGESENPQRDVPRAAVGSLLAATLLYVLIQAAAVGSFPGLAASKDKPLADAASFLLGPLGGGLLAAGALLSMSGFLAGAALGAPRYLSALGEDGFVSGALGRFHPRFGTPYVSILWTTLAAAVLSLFLDFVNLVNISNLAVASQYLSTCAAALVLRHKRPELPRPYRAPWIWLAAPAGCLISLWLMSQVGKSGALAGAAVLAAGALAAAANKALRREKV